MIGTGLAPHPSASRERRSPTPHATKLDFLPGNRVQVLRDGAETLPAMFAAIRAARASVCLETYVFEEVYCEGESISQLLAARSAAGVIVAIIYDSAGSARTPPVFFDALRRAGVRLLEFNPLNPLRARRVWAPNRRDHRKLLVIDGEVALIGGINVSAVYEHRAPGPLRATVGAHALDETWARGWRDTDLQLHGPAVAPLQSLFVSQWTRQRGDTLPALRTAAMSTADGVERVGIVASAASEGRRYYHLLLSVLRAAQERVWITAGYFLPNPDQKAALIEAAARGADVRLLLAAHNDSRGALAVQRHAYADLLRANVKIYERAGAILHAKTIIVDSTWCAVGSSNFDPRSVWYNDEIDVIVDGARTAAALTRLFAADLQQSRLIEPAAWRRRSWAQRLHECIWKLGERLL